MHTEVIYHYLYQISSILEDLFKNRRLISDQINVDDTVPVLAKKKAEILAVC